MANFVKAALTSDLQPGQGKCVTVGDREVALFNCDGKFYAIDNVCPHQGGPLGEGELDGTVVTCPWHGWRFDVATGGSPVVPGAKVPKYEVKVEGTDVLVAV
jgi:nitrite reductase (NADH) small subunit